MSLCSYADLRSKMGGQVIRKIVFSLFGLTVAAFFASADTPPNIPHQSPPLSWEWVERPGEPLKIVFNDGRELTVEWADRPVVTWSWGATITENHCTHRVNIPCRISQGYHAYGSRAIWTKNPDPQRLNKVVEYKYEGGEWADLARPFELNAYPSVQKFNLDLPLQPFSISCNSYDWIPGVSALSSPSVEVPLLAAEFMFRNSETGHTDNQILSGAAGVHFEMTPIGLSMNGSETWFENGLDFASGGLGDVITLQVLDRQKGEPCQISMKTPIIEVQQQAAEYFLRPMGPFQPISFGQHRFLDSRQALSGMRSIFRGQNNMALRLR
jgi:hypothetical protein